MFRHKVNLNYLYGLTFLRFLALSIMKTMEMTQGKELPIWFYTFFCDEQLDHHKTKINTKLDTQ